MRAIMARGGLEAALKRGEGGLTQSIMSTSCVKDDS